MNKPQVQKLIYKITNIENDLCYIGQTYSIIKKALKYKEDIEKKLIIFTI